MARRALDFNQWVSAGGYDRVKWSLAYLDRKGGIPTEWRGNEADVIIRMLEGKLIFRYGGEAFSRMKSAWGAHKSRLAQKETQGGFEQVTIRGRLGLRARFKALLQAIDASPEDALELLITDVQEFKKRLKADEHKALTLEIKRLKGQESQRPKRERVRVIGSHLVDELKMQQRTADTRLMELCRYHILYGGLPLLSVEEETRASELYQEKSAPVVLPAVVSAVEAEAVTNEPFICDIEPEAPTKLDEPSEGSGNPGRLPSREILPIQDDNVSAVSTLVPESYYQLIKKSSLNADIDESLLKKSIRSIRKKDKQLGATTPLTDAQWKRVLTSYSSRIQDLQSKPK